MPHRMMTCWLLMNSAIGCTAAVIGTGPNCQDAAFAMRSVWFVGRCVPSWVAILSPRPAASLSVCVSAICVGPWLPCVTPSASSYDALRRSRTQYILRDEICVYMGLDPLFLWALGGRTSGTSLGPALHASKRKRVYAYSMCHERLPHAEFFFK
jgi:hypothetical protein